MFVRCPSDLSCHPSTYTAFGGSTTTTTTAAAPNTATAAAVPSTVGGMGGSTAADLPSLLREYGAVKLGDVVKMLQKGVEDDLEVPCDTCWVV